MLSDFLILSNEVKDALKEKKAVVALESTVISHGPPYPDNVEVTKAMLAAVRESGAVPALITLKDHRIHIGFDETHLDLFADPSQIIEKVSLHNLASTLASGALGATTVAATMRCAALAGIQFFATGGIGGAHRGCEISFDISADLEALASEPVMVICSGAKSILDIPKTLEILETKAVPIIGYKSDNLPLFYTQKSPYAISERMDSMDMICTHAKLHWEMGGAGIVLANPIPGQNTLLESDVEGWVEVAQKEAETQKIMGKKVTPFLLKRVGELSKGRTKAANKALLIHNAKIAGMIANTYY